MRFELKNLRSVVKGIEIMRHNALEEVSDETVTWLFDQY